MGLVASVSLNRIFSPRPSNLLCRAVLVMSGTSLWFQGRCLCASGRRPGFSPAGCVDHARAPPQFPRLVLHANLIRGCQPALGPVRNLKNGLHDAADPDESELIVPRIRQNRVNGGHGIRVQRWRLRSQKILCGADAGRREEEQDHQPKDGEPCQSLHTQSIAPPDRVRSGE